MTSELKNNIHNYVTKHITEKARLARIVAELSECLSSACDTQVLSDSVHHACAESIYRHTIEQAGKDFLAKDGADSWPPIKTKGLFPTTALMRWISSGSFESSLYLSSSPQTSSERGW